MAGIAKSPFGGVLAAAFTLFEPAVAAACLAVAAVIGVMSSLVPALSASRIRSWRRCGARINCMAIPLAYNLRNLVVRKTTTLMTALGIALTVAVLLAILALVNGLEFDAFGFGRSAACDGDAQGRGIGGDEPLHAAAVSGSEVQAGNCRADATASRWRRSKWSP